MCDVKKGKIDKLFLVDMGVTFLFSDNTEDVTVQEDVNEKDVTD